VTVSAGRVFSLVVGAMVGAAVMAAPVSAQGLYYREVVKDGKVYVFNLAREFEAFQSGIAPAKPIERLGWGPKGETVVFDSPDALNLFAFKYGKAAEAPPAAPSPAPAAAKDDTPTVKVGGTIYANYTYTADPTAKDSDGNTIHPNAFDDSRAYITLSGNISHLVGFRITADVGPRQATVSTGLPAGAAVSSNYDGSLTYRLKYAYGQVNLDDVLTKGSWARIGMQQTPFLDFMEGVYRYRFQGTLFAEREGYLPSGSSDFGLSAHYNLPNDYGDVHTGIYNGENYNKGEANDQKAFQVRGTLRPVPKQEVLKGLRLSAFYDADHYVKDAPRQRFIGSVTFEHKYVNLGIDYLDAKDQTSTTKPEVRASGFSAWAQPKTTKGIEGFLRYDSLKPSKHVDARKNRTIVGVAYWFKTLKAPAAAALLLDYEHVGYDAPLAKPNESRYALHCLFNF